MSSTIYNIIENILENRDKIYKSTTLDDYGRVKISLSKIWKETYLPRLKNNCNIMCNLVESDKDGEIYSIDV